MLALTRVTPTQLLRPAANRLSIRPFAQVVPSSSESLNERAVAVQSPGTPHKSPRRTTTSESLSNVRIPTREDHGLYGFFRRKDDPDLTGDARFETVETPEKAQKLTGRGWRASELRLKSFEDLHTLWYVLLRERNLLATQKEETRRMGVTHTQSQVSLERVHACRKSMARIKAVINERRLAYEGAVKLAEEQREHHYGEVVKRYLLSEQKEERKYLQRRREFMARRAEAKRLRQEESAKAPPKTLEVASQLAEEVKVAETTSEVQGEATTTVEAQSLPGNKVTEPTTTEVSKGSPAKPADSVAAGLFGEVHVQRDRRRP